MLWSVDRCEGLRYKTSPNISLLFATLCGGALLLSTQTGNCSKYCLLAFPPDLEHRASTRHPPDRVTDDMLPRVTPRALHGPETTTDYLKAKKKKVERRCHRPAFLLSHDRSEHMGAVCYLSELLTIAPW